MKSSDTVTSTDTLSADARIVITGAAGLVGQNLALRLTERGYTDIVGIDKNAHNLAILKRHQPDVRTLLADLAVPGDWQDEIKRADAVVLNQAQIGGLDWEDFRRNNIDATGHILDAVRRADDAPYIVHISSSVVNSRADDFYTRSKTLQEEMVARSGLDFTALRPTLMFGWFDRKHLGWLRRFMAKAPAFPIPGSGRYARQPLYVGDFCRVVIACLEQQPGGIHDISGQEVLDYIDLIRTIKSKTGERTPIFRIPYWSFFAGLWGAARIMPDPPFTIHQLRALVIPETFPVVDWPGMFGVEATPFAEAVDETFNHPVHSGVVLEF